MEAVQSNEEPVTESGADGQFIMADDVNEPEEAGAGATTGDGALEVGRIR